MSLFDRKSWGTRYGECRGGDEKDKNGSCQRVHKVRSDTSSTRGDLVGCRERVDQAPGGDEVPWTKEGDRIDERVEAIVFKIFESGDGYGQIPRSPTGRAGIVHVSQNLS